MPTFRNQFVIFPAGKLSAAQAYRDFANAWWQTVSGVPGDLLTDIKQDRHGQWVVTYAGPFLTFDGVNVLAEPSGGPAARVEGVLAEDWDRPDPEEV
jgi:hypothetical protein